MSYQFIGEDDETFKVQHPDGSEFTIAKSAVGPEVHKRIKGLKPIKMSDGGITPDFEQIETEQPDKTIDKNPLINQNGLLVDADTQERFPASDPNLVIDQLPESRPMPALSQGEDSGLVAPVVQGNQAVDQTMANPYSMAALDSQKQANTELGQAQASGMQQQSKNWQDYEKKVQDVEAQYKPKEDELNRRSDELQKAILNQTIDSNRIWHNASTGNKVLASIGILLSGIGSGLTGQKNLALDVIDKETDRDIRAQEMELGKKQTLFSENLRQLGDMRAAKAATKAQLIAVNQARANSIAAQSGSKEVMARVKVLNIAADMEKAKLNQEAAWRHLGMTGGGGSGGSIDPSMLVSKLVPKEHQKSVFDEIQRAQDTRHMGDSILKSFDDASKDNTIIRTGGGLLRTPSSVLALHQSMQPTFKDLEGTVRQAAMDNTFKNITPAPGDTDGTIKEKRQALVDYLQSKAAAPTAKGFGIDLDKFSSTTTSRPETAMMGGEKYQKVQGGWKKI